MGYVFVSHASDDKQRVKPLVEALAIEGVQLWLDRPGHGKNHFNFDQAFIEHYGIQGLQAGQPWNDQILHALYEAGAVLVCLSVALCAQRLVLVQELLLGWHHHKLVACIVDELSYSQIPSDLGLPDASKLQAERINPDLLRQAISTLRNQQKAVPDDLPPILRDQWEIVRKLVSDIHRIDRSPRLPSAAESAKLHLALSTVPIGPMVRAYEIPIEVIRIFGDHFGDPEKAQNFLSFAMQIRSHCNPENFTEQQILIRSGEVLNPYAVTPDEYWSSVLTVAGIRSRRTLASFLMAPGAPNPDVLRPDLRSILGDFRKWLEQSSL